MPATPPPLPPATAAEAPAADDFFDVEAALRDSERRGTGAWASYLVLGAIAAVLAGLFIGGGGTLAAALVMLGLLAAGVAIPSAALRRHRAEGRAVEAIEELVLLRRWPDAAWHLRELLSGPMRNPAGRARALIALSAVLMRYERFDDAIRVQTYLTGELGLAGPAGHAVRVGRTMAELRSDHLHDADSSLSGLKRDVARQNRASESEEDETSAGLALAEMYRDVKTGHPDEAIEVYERSLPSVRRQMGHRSADAHVLAAAAYARLDRPEEAAVAYDAATRLAPAAELNRRYPEIRELVATLQPAVAP